MTIIELKRRVTFKCRPEFRKPNVST